MKERLLLPSDEIARTFSGVGEGRLREFRRLLRVEAVLRGTMLLIDGDPAAAESAARAAREIIGVLEDAGEIAEEELGRILELHRAAGGAGGAGGAGRKVTRALIAPGGRRVEPATEGQADYVEAIRRHDLTFCTGVAGTGKTYLAAAAALEALGNERVSRIVIVRPAVEAGEHLGFLPGDFREKVSPYLRPITDALAEMISFRQLERYLEHGVVEIAPLAYMRGRTLGGAFAILDEAQNTSSEQMKMFLTRLGPSSKAVVTGDVTQIDLPEKKKSGMLTALRILSGLPGMAFVNLTEIDIVRHPLVKAIVDAWAKHSSPGSRDGAQNSEGQRPRAESESRGSRGAERAPGEGR